VRPTLVFTGDDNASPASAVELQIGGRTGT